MGEMGAAGLPGMWGTRGGNSEDPVETVVVASVARMAPESLVARTASERTGAWMAAGRAAGRAESLVAQMGAGRVVERMAAERMGERMAPGTSVVWAVRAVGAAAAMRRSAGLPRLCR